MELSFFFKDTATTEIYTLSLHDARPICGLRGTPGTGGARRRPAGHGHRAAPLHRRPALPAACAARGARSEEHTSELQSRQYLVCRLLLEQKTQWSTTLPFLPCSTSLDAT